MITKRQTWEQDQPSARMMIKSCISCPDSEGFCIDENGDMVSQKPCCSFSDKHKTYLRNFPYIPSFCPRLWAQLDDNEPVFVHPNDSYESFERQQLFEMLSDEAKEVIRIVLGLPMGVIVLSAWFAHKVIIMGIESIWDNKRPKKSFAMVSNELRNYVRCF